MTKAEFWELIASTKKGDPEAHVERLVAALAKMDPKEIVSFGSHWIAFHAKAYQWPLWGAAYLMNGGCSDDGFIDFRSWLLLLGEAVYTAALENPESLAKVKVEPDEAACECYPAPRAYDLAMGTNDSNAFYDALEKAGGFVKQAEEPTGEQWDFDDDEEMKTRLPKLHRKFADG